MSRTYSDTTGKNTICIAATAATQRNFHGVPSAFQRWRMWVA